MTETAAIVIANWNGRTHLEHCLPALFDQTFTDYRVTLVDNGSTDGSAEWVASRFPQVNVVRLPDNIGFAAANNLGIGSTSSRYVATLNNDAQVSRGWLAALIAAAESDDRIGACASCIRLADRPDAIDSAGIDIDRLGFAWQRGRGRPAAAYRAAADVFGPSAAAALYRRSMLERIGVFDEDFGSYYEDVDLAWRARRQGWRCRYAPEADVLHVHSATGRRDPDRKLYQLTRNRWWTLIKNYPLPALWLMLPLIAAADAASLARGLIAQRNATALRARADAWRGLRRMWRKRGG